MIHRDLKPSNVLVTLYDGKPVPKVIDFGVAKALHQRLTDKTMFTEFGAVVGTLEYMAPEQAELSHLDVDTRSDVYSLGVLLYELLTGSTPLDRQRLKSAAFDEMLRIIREEEPPKPSTRLSGSGDRLPSIAAQRKTEPAKLSRLVKGELDWIVMKALEKDRGRRYETANGFARDVQRYLADEAVEACPPSAGYRLRKFARKNRAVLSAAAAITMLLVAGVAVSTWQAVRATRAEQDARAAAAAEAAQRTVAQDNERKALAAAAAETEAKETALAREAETRAVLAFVETKVFAAGRPKGQAGGLGYDVTLAEAVRAALPFVQTSFTDQPLIEARLRTTLGSSFLYLGDAKIAAELFQTARALYTRHSGPDHPSTLRSMNDLANSYFALGRHADAAELRRETLALTKAKLGPDHPSTLGSMVNLANSHRSLGRLAEAVVLYEVALPRMRATMPEHHFTFNCMAGLATSYAALGRHADALKLREGALALRKARLGPDHPDTLRSMWRLAESLVTLGRGGEAVPIIDDCLRRAAVKAVGPRLIPEVLALRLRHFEKSKDAAGCRETARMWENLKRTDADSLYTAARMRAVCCGVLTDKPDAANAEADRAMAWLRKALAAGYRDVPHLLNDPDLAAVRGRADFADLLWDLADAAPVVDGPRPGG